MGTTAAREFPRLLVRRRTAPSTRGRTVMWLVLAAALLLLPFLSLPGHYVNDTRDALWLHPGAYLSRAFTLWWSSPFLGHEQHDAIVFPMGLSVWALRALGLSAWAAERVWHGLLLLGSAGGTILLVDHLLGRRTVVGPLTAGLAYALTPYTFGYGLPTTGAFLAYVLLPVLLLVTGIGARRGGLVWAALFALTSFAMGGGNGAPQVYALITAGLFLLWILLTDRSIPRARPLRFAGMAFLLTIAVDAHWLFLLTSGEVSNALAFSEQPSIINASSSASETVRGLGFWMFYGGDRFGSWVPTVRSFSSNPLLILSGFAIPVAALVSAWRVRWRDRAFFVLLAVVSVFVVAGVFPVGSPTPFGRMLLAAYRDVPGAAGLRTTYKFASALALSLAVLAGVGVAMAWDRWSRRSPRAGRAALAALIAVVIGLNAHPILLGRMHNPARSIEEVPGYWDQAVAWLEERDAGFRSFFAPATDRTTYTWGTLREGIAASTPDLATVRPHRLPVGQRYGSNLILAIEEPYFQGIPTDAVAPLLRVLGVRFVVLQNDIDTARSDTAAVGDVRRLLQAPGLEPIASFGQPDQAAPREGEAGPPPPPVEVLRVIDPLPVVRTEVGTPTVVSGDGFGLAAAAREGLLQRRRPVLYSATLDEAALRRLLEAGDATFVITDSNRRRWWSFASPHAERSYTLQAGAEPPGRGAPFGLFDDDPDTQTVAEYAGLAGVSASGFGGVLREEPAFRPANAFDGDDSTWWVAGVLGDPRGEWVRADLSGPRRLDSVRLVVPDFGFGRQLESVRVEFSDGTSQLATVQPGENVLEFRARTTGFLRVRIVSVRESPTGARNGVGLAEVDIPGVDGEEQIRVPVDLFELARRVDGGVEGLARSSLHYVFERSRTADPDRNDEEVRLVRRFEVPALDVLALHGTASLNTRAADEDLDRVILGPTPVTATSSTRLFADPRFRASAALDGRLDTAWVARAREGESITLRFPEQEVSQIDVVTELGEERAPILRVLITFPDGSTEVGSLASFVDGTISVGFEPRRVDGLTVAVAQLGPTRPAAPMAISEIRIDGVEMPSVRAADELGCVDGALRLDTAAVSVHPVGTVGELLAGRSLPLELCKGPGLVAGAGWHVIRAEGALRTDSLMLSSTPDPPTPETGEGEAAALKLPLTEVEALAGGGYDVRIRNATSAYHLVIGQNLSTGWKASIDGEDLGPAILVDGFSAGWRIDRPGHYTVNVRYGPQGGYNLALILSALSLAVVLALLGVASSRRGRRT